LMSAQKKLLVKGTDEQIPAIPNLKHDFSVMIDENGTQVQTVGNHWKLSQALDKKTRDKLDRRGACLACHQEMSNKDLAVSLLVHTAKYAGFNIDNKMHNNLVHKSILLSAWVQVLAVFLVLFGLVFWWRRK